MPKIEQKEIFSAIIVVGFILAGVILLKDSKPPIKVENTVPAVVGSATMGQSPVLADDHIIGDLNAKVIIIGYSDLECPFCKVFHNTMKQVMQTATTDVAWVYRHYPIPELHQMAFIEAEATECAWEQGGNEAFWKYTDRVFEVTPSNDGLTNADLPVIAEYIGLDVNAFNECLVSGKFKTKVQADLNAGVLEGVSGTPSSFIYVNGELVDTIPGAEPYASVKQKIDRALQL
jgi:protein-disulfide isomerase